MKRLHPNRRFATLIAGLLVAACAGGCRGSQSSMSNPFLGPDRVPPPSTRVVAPGAAAPYYPGASVPAAQNANAAPNTSMAAAPTTAPQPSATNPGAPVFSSPTRAVASANESPVTIPADDSQMRFPLPAPPPNVAVNTAPQVPPSATSVAASTPTLAASAVTPAAYNSAEPYRIAEAGQPAANSSGPWRSPQIARAGTAPTLALPPQVSQVVAPAWQQLAPAPPPAVVAPPLAPVASMPVQLRAVSSPPVLQTATSQPRIHFPSQITGNAPTNGVVAASAQTPAGAPVAGNVVQTVQISELPASMATAPARAATPSSPDGFRPRSTLR